MVGREPSLVVLTTIRHPAATFLSFFHYVKWHDAGLDPSAAMLKEDGDRPGKNALTYINYSFPQIYAISLAWARLGSHVVRYGSAGRSSVATPRGHVQGRAAGRGETEGGSISLQARVSDKAWSR